MNINQFKSVGPLLKAITNRKIDLEKNKISWLKTYEIELKKDIPCMMYLKSALNETSRIVDISKNKKLNDMHHFQNISLPLLWPNGKELSSSKVKDLKDILKFIPEDCKHFYSFLETVRSAEFEDDFEGIGRTIDYEIEQDEED